MTCLPLRFEVDSVEPIAFVLTSSILIRRLETASSGEPHSMSA